MEEIYLHRSQTNHHHYRLRVVPTILLRTYLEPTPQAHKENARSSGAWDITFNNDCCEVSSHTVYLVLSTTHCVIIVVSSILTESVGCILFFSRNLVLGANRRTQTLTIGELPNGGGALHEAKTIEATLSLLPRQRI